MTHHLVPAYFFLQPTPAQSDVVFSCRIFRYCNSPTAGVSNMKKKRNETGWSPICAIRLTQAGYEWTRGSEPSRRCPKPRIPAQRSSRVDIGCQLSRWQVRRSPPVFSVNRLALGCHARFADGVWGINHDGSYDLLPPRHCPLTPYIWTSDGFYLVSSTVLLDRCWRSTGGVMLSFDINPVQGHRLRSNPSWLNMGDRPLSFRPD